MRWGIRTSIVVGLAGLLLVAGGVAALVVVRLVGAEAEAQVLAQQRARAVAEAEVLAARCAAAEAGGGARGCAAVVRATLERWAGAGSGVAEGRDGAEEGGARRGGTDGHDAEDGAARRRATDGHDAEDAAARRGGTADGRDAEAGAARRGAADGREAGRGEARRGAVGGREAGRAEARRGASDGRAAGGRSEARRAVVGPDGRWWVGGGGPPAGAVLDVLQGGAADWSRVVRGLDDPRGAGVDHRVVAPVSIGAGQRAALVVDFDLDPLHAAVAARQRMALAYLLASLLGVLVFGLYVSGRALVRPVVALTRAVERIGAGGEGEARLPAPAGPAELWRLHEAFGAMLGRVRAAQAELVRHEKLATVGRLAAGVAHEVGNPLAAVMGYVEFLRDPRGCPDALRAELLERMDRELGRMRDTLRRLLDFSRPAPAAPVVMRLEDAARAAVELVRFQRSMAGVEVTVEGEAPAVVADPGQMRQVFVNLLLNAGEAMQGAGRVWVALSEVEGEARAVVRDAGPGVDAAVASRIFDPFVTARRSGEGTGLGLAIALRLVEEAGGRLWLASAPGEAGAVFEVALPAAA